MTSSDGTKSRSVGRCRQHFQSYRSLLSKKKKKPQKIQFTGIYKLHLEETDKKFFLKTRNSYLEGLFIDIYVISSFDFFGLAEEDEVLKQEDVAEVFPPSTPDYELILAAELTLLFQVHLERKHDRSHASERTIQVLVGF